MDKAQSQPIPVEKGWPLLGVLPKLFNGDPFEYLKNVMLERGDFVQLNIGTQPVYLVSHPDYLKRILWENHHNYRRPGMFYNILRRIAGNGLATSEGDFWLRQRRMIQPHLHRKNLAYLFAEMTGAIDDVLTDWMPLAKDSVEIEMGSRMGEITGVIITRTLFGKGILPTAEVSEICSYIFRINKFGGQSGLLPEWIPLPGRKQFRDDINATREAVNYIIAKSRQEKETSASLIKMLINTVDDESQEQMTEQQLFDEVMTLVIAGYETTATALTWFIVAMQQWPEVFEKLRAEIDQVLGSRPPSFDDVPRLVYTRQALMETLRMYTVVPFLSRAVNETDQLGPYTLPANALLFVFLHGVHHNPRAWPNPKVFDPDRFSPEGIANQHPFAYLPFSAGPRKCVGNEFALLEGTLIIAMLLQKYNLNMLPNQTFQARMGSMMHPHMGVKLTLSIRQ